MSRFIRLLKTTTFRFAVLYTAVFACSVGALFAFVFINTSIFAERQVEAAIQAEVQGFQETYRREGLVGLRGAINRRVDPNVRTDGIYLLVDAMGRRVAGNLTAWPRDTEADDLWINFSILEMQSAEASTADVRALQFRLSGGYELLVGRDIRVARDFRQQLLRSLNIGLGLTIAIGVLGGFLFSRSIMGRVERITQICRRIMRGDLSQRMEGAGQDDELSRLSESINEMLDQIERLMNGLREVSDNVAHDLRTPLNRLRSHLETALHEAGESPEKERLEAAIREADGLLATFAALLRIARAEASLSHTFKTIDLGIVAEDVVDLYQPLAEEKAIQFEIAIDPDAKAWGDANLVAQALANLTDNAIKFTPENGKVAIAVATENGRSTFTVADTGPGIPPDFREKVFDRLFRLDASRTTPGSGLGLSLVGAVAKSHGIEVALSDNAPGLRVKITFPTLPRQDTTVSSAA